MTNPAIIVKEAVLSKIAPPISEAVGRTYKYLSIVSPDAKVSSAAVRFSVSKVWLSDNRVSPQTVRLNRLQGSQWASLPTRLVSEEGAFASYEATTPGFSIFAISGELAPFVKAASVTAPAPQKPVAPVQPEAAPVVPAAPAPEGGGLAPITGNVVAGESGKLRTSALNALIFAAFIALIGIVAFKVMRMRRTAVRHTG